MIAQDFGITTDELANIPDGELFIFPGTAAPADIQEQTVQNSNGMLEGNETYSYHFSLQEPLSVPGGSVKILDPLTFPIAEKFSVALVTIEPGAMREIHWHPTSDEWTFFLYGRSRATLFQASDTATTFDYGPGDVGYFPQSASHYVQNVGDEDVVILEVLSADHFSGTSSLSISSWPCSRMLTSCRCRPRPVDRNHPTADYPRYAQPEPVDRPADGQCQGEAVRRPRRRPCSGTNCLEEEEDVARMTSSASMSVLKGILQARSYRTFSFSFSFSLLFVSTMASQSKLAL